MALTRWSRRSPFGRSFSRVIGSNQDRINAEAATLVYGRSESLNEIRREIAGAAVF
jgi:hypothetical protein